ncbi:hypothetical protein KC340_g11976 [Hortaea werneckii]|nr:hypothetical protein KC342_g12287 [Hortaea werneckii]KAI7095190.1 hypothetical protein KC339_g11151 [Hortaea werneckii]KAI7305473.1 hypothetical protein KC340_g11976 [Hortaea werneckii]KAI7391980.1 hypothetical protein KC328_g7245 [Hortaea werneckii]KAI7478873.1 hypothetical protein KC351_g7911 [Hortaea werneckii]
MTKITSFFRASSHHSHTSLGKRKREQIDPADDGDKENTAPASVYITQDRNSDLDNVQTHSLVIALPLSAAKTVPYYMSVFQNLYTILEADSARGFDHATQFYGKNGLLALKDRLLSIAGDTKFAGAGHYMDCLTDMDDPDWFKIYIGQATVVKNRVDYHKKPTVLQEQQALHYRLLRGKQSRPYNYVLLIKMPQKLEFRDEVLEMLEMYAGLLFQALPRKTLLKYLPQDVKIFEPERGCMVANPLNTRHDPALSRLATCQLQESSDPEVRSHYKHACEYLKQVAYVPTINALRAKSKKKDLQRPPENQFEAVVWMQCGRCKTIKQDPAPIFEIVSGAYLVRQQRCMTCTIPGAQKGSRKQHAKVMFYPIDGRPTMSHSHLGKHKQNPKSTNQYANNSQWKEPLAQVHEAGKMVDNVLDLEAAADEQE